MMAAVSFSARTAEVVSKLMHDVETNPGPNCSQVRRCISVPLTSGFRNSADLVQIDFINSHRIVQLLVCIFSPDNSLDFHSDDQWPVSQQSLSMAIVMLNIIIATFSFFFNLVEQTIITWHLKSENPVPTLYFFYFIRVTAMVLFWVLLSPSIS